MEVKKCSTCKVEMDCIYKTCERCRERCRIYKKNHMEESTKYNKESMIKYRESGKVREKGKERRINIMQQIENGLKVCSNCGRENDTDKRRCSKCVEYLKIYRSADKFKEKKHQYEKENIEVIAGYKRKWHEENKGTIKFKIGAYIRSARVRGLEFNLDEEMFIMLINAKCHYCSGEGGGIDRIDSSLGYIQTNVLPCCWHCNMMKNDRSYDDFLKICEHLTAFNMLAPGREQYDGIFHISKDPKISYYKRNAELRNLPWELSDNEYNEFITDNCIYCGRDNASGIDRVNNAIGYEKTNCAPCCKTCNLMKSNFTTDEFLNQCLKIRNNHL